MNEPAGTTLEASLVADGPQFELVDDPEWVGPHEEWYCGCHPKLLHSPRADWCLTCRVAAPWMTWERVDA